MRVTGTDSIKQRLTDRVQLAIAVDDLLKRGVPVELIPVHLARAFYVDMDELNAVLESAARGESARRAMSAVA